MDQHVLLAHGREDVAAIVADPFRVPGLIAGEFQVRMAGRNQVRHLRQPQHAGDQNDVAGGGVQLVGDEGAQVGGHAGLDLDPHHRAEAALLQRLLEFHDQIFGLLLDLDVRIADQAEHAAFQNFAAGEQMIDEDHQQAFQGHVAALAGLRAPVGGQGPEALHLGRHRNQGVEGAIIAPPPQLQRQREAEVGQEGKGVGRINGHRGQNGEQAVEEFRLQPFPLGLGDAVRVDDLDPGDGQLLAQLAPAPLLLVHQHTGGQIDLFQRLGRGQAVGRDDPDPLAYLPLQPGDPGHEELIEIVGRNRQEAQPFQQRVGGVGGFFQYAGVEFQPRDFAIEEPLRRGHQAFGQVHLRRARRRDLLAGGLVRDGSDFGHGPVLTRGCDGCKRSAPFAEQTMVQLSLFGWGAVRGQSNNSRVVASESRTWRASRSTTASTAAADRSIRRTR